MIISPQKAYSKKYITNLLDPAKQVGSDGIDLTIHSIARLDMTDDAVLSETKTINKHRNREGIPTTTDVGGHAFFVLSEGVYDMTFNEGCNLPKGIAAMLLLRSSLARNGCQLASGLYDAGFVTSNAGALLHVRGGGKIRIERNVRVAQIILIKSDTHKLYNGQYNNQTGLNWLKSWTSNRE